MRHLLKIVPLILISCSLLATRVNHFNLDHPELILSALSLRQKIGQLCIVATVSNEEKNPDTIKQWHDWQPLCCLKTDYVKKLVEEYHVGGVMFYGKKTLPEELRTLIHELQELSPVPLFMAMDAECGLGNWFAPGSVITYPRAMALSATNDPACAYKLGYEIGIQLKSINVQINWAPVVDVNCNPDNPVIGSRSFGSDPAQVIKMATAFVNGLQDARRIGCIKHFPGHGDTATDSHIGLPVIEYDRLRLNEIELLPFAQVIQNAQPKSVMVGHLKIPALDDIPSTVSYEIVTKLLVEELNFKELIVTDALGMHGIANYANQPGEGEVDVLALLAGVDILLCPIDLIKTIDAVEQAVKEGRISEEEIDRKVLKVLRAKQWSFSEPYQEDVDLEKVLFSDTAKALQKELYSKAITLQKINENYDYLATKAKPTIIALSDNSTALSNEQQVPYLRLPYNIEPTEIATIIKSIKTKHVVVSIHNPKWWNYAEHQVPEGISALIARLKELRKLVTVIVFGSPYTARNLKNADAIILGYEDNKHAQEAVLEVVMGRQKATGVCPV